MHFRALVLVLPRGGRGEVTAGQIISGRDLPVLLSPLVKCGWKIIEQIERSKEKRST